MATKTTKVAPKSTPTVAKKVKGAVPAPRKSK